jgi:hypothetical protein
VYTAFHVSATSHDWASNVRKLTLLHPDGVNVGGRLLLLIIGPPHAASLRAFVRAPQQQQAIGESGSLQFFTSRVRPHGVSKEIPKTREFQLYDRKTKARVQRMRALRHASSGWSSQSGKKHVPYVSCLFEIVHVSS